MNDRRLIIMDAFLRLVERNGVNKTTMQDIAKEAGIGVGTIYNEFTNKEALIDGLFEKYQSVMEQEIEELTVEEPPENALRRLLIGQIRSLNCKIRQDRGFSELFSQENVFRYIGKKNIDLRNTLRNRMIKKITLLLNCGCEQGTFHINNSQQTARLILDAFTEYLAPPLVINRTLEEVIADAEAMCEFIFKAIK